MWKTWIPRAFSCPQHKSVDYLHPVPCYNWVTTKQKKQKQELRLFYHEIYRNLSNEAKFTYFFLEKLTKGLSKPRKKFYSDILYGMSKAQNTLLSDIARALEEKIDLQYTIKRLSRNAAEENDLKQIHRNYLNTLKTSIPDNPLVIVDESEIVKPYAEKNGRLSASAWCLKNVLEKGYPTLNFQWLLRKPNIPYRFIIICTLPKKKIFKVRI